MAYSIHSYVGDNTDAELAVNFTLGFLNRSDVHAQVEGEGTERTITWINDGLITIGVVTSGLAITIRRQTTKTALAHDYSNGAVIVDAHLDNSNLQNIMLVHEILDGFRDEGFEHRGNEDFGGYRIVNLGEPVDGSDAVTKSFADSVLATTAASEAAAAASEVAAAASESAAASSESSAASSASLASAAKTAAQTAQTAAELAETNAELAETNAAASKVAAELAETHAELAETNASASAGAAATSETNAGTSETNAGASASAAATSETNAGTSETNAAASAASASADLATFQGQYYGPLAVAPTVNVVVGDLYFNTTASIMKVCSSIGPDVWINSGSSVNGIDQSERYVATAGQTDFSITYDVGYVHVYLNGTKLDTTDFTATTGTNVVLASGATLGDIVCLVAFGTFALADHYTKTEADAQFGHLAGFKNKIINGNFDVWQRGISFPTPEDYTADRWKASTYGSNLEIIQTPISASDLRWEPSARYVLNLNKTTAFGGGVSMLEHRIENPRQFSGKTVTLSFDIGNAVSGYFKCDFLCVINGVPVMDIEDIDISSAADVVTRNEVTYTFPDFITGETLTDDDFLALRFICDDTTTFTNLQISRVQLEVSSVATAFEQRHIAQELALCQRYYYNLDGTWVQGFPIYNSTTNLIRRAEVAFPVNMRGTPSAIVTGNAGWTTTPVLHTASKTGAVFTGTAASAPSGTTLTTAIFDAEL